jgi:hypothetical protein
MGVVVSIREFSTCVLEASLCELLIPFPSVSGNAVTVCDAFGQLPTQTDCLQCKDCVPSMRFPSPELLQPCIGALIACLSVDRWTAIRAF